MKHNLLCFLFMLCNETDLCSLAMVPRHKNVPRVIVCDQCWTDVCHSVYGAGNGCLTFRSLQGKEYQSSFWTAKWITVAVF
jgi:hypothetical protein